MRQRAARRAWVIALAVLAGAPGLASAQYPSAAGGVSTGTYGASAGMAANPYANSYLNPFLNPFMMQGSTVSPQNSLMFFMAAQQMNGGIGSGQLSGVRPRPDTRPAPARGDTSRTSGGLTGRTARYFNRSYADKGSLSRYYGRQDSYFPSNR